MINGRIIPPGMTFERALRLGYAGEIRLAQYLDWIRGLPCDTCMAGPRSEASHPNFFKSQLHKGPDPLAIPECRRDHAVYEAGGPDEEHRLARAALYMLQAIFEGRLVWRKV